MRMLHHGQDQTILPHTSLRHEDAQLASSPRIRSDRQEPLDAEAMQKARLAVHRRSACSGVKALRNTSAASRQAAKLCYRFGPLTPSARSANLIAGDGTKNGFPAPNKEPLKTKNDYLTRKAPYKFESVFLQQRVCLCTAFHGIGEQAGASRPAIAAGRRENDRPGRKGADLLYLSLSAIDAVPPQSGCR